MQDVVEDSPEEHEQKLERIKAQNAEESANSSRHEGKEKRSYSANLISEASDRLSNADIGELPSTAASEIDITKAEGPFEPQADKTEPKARRGEEDMKEARAQDVEEDSPEKRKQNLEDEALMENEEKSAKCDGNDTATLDSTKACHRHDSDVEMVESCRVM